MWGVAWKTNEEEKGEASVEKVDENEDYDKEEEYKEVRKTCRNFLGNKSQTTQ